MGNTCKASTDDHNIVLGTKDKNFVPKNVWDEKTVMERTDNFDRLMGRTWYLIANSMEGADQA